MSKEGIHKALLKIADDLLDVASAVLDSDEVGINVKVGKNTLRDSALRGELAGRISETVGDDPVVGAFFRHYVVFLEWDRPPKYGRQPPIDALKGWAEKNKIPTDAHTLWAISYAIWRDGHKGRPIFATIDERVDRLFSEQWGDETYEAIVDTLNSFFKD